MRLRVLRRWAACVRGARVKCPDETREVASSQQTPAGSEAPRVERERNEPLRGRRGPPGRVQVVRRAHGVMARGVFDAEPAHAGGGGASMMEPFEALKHARAEMARLGADNAALRREAHTLKTTVAELRESRERDDARTRLADDSRRSDALRHLTAAEDHVALLLGESRGRLDAMAREDGDRASGAKRGRLAGALDDDERRELELLRVEVREHVRARAEMDAEAEEREDELREAYAHVKRLQEAARVAAS